MTDQPPITYAKAAAQIGVSRQRVQTFVDQGRLGTKHADGTYTITQAELDKFKAIKRKPGRPSLAVPERRPLYCAKCKKVTVMSRTGKYWICSQCETAHPTRPQPAKG